MVGSLFFHEMLLASRRTREQIFRWIYAGWLILQLLGFTVATLLTFSFQRGTDLGAFTPFLARDFTEVFLVQHLILIVLVTPAFVASAITDEKTRGTLQYLLTTELTPLHILLGKLLGGVVQVLILSLVGLPLVCFLGVLGGLDLSQLFSLAVVTVEVVVGMASATLLAAVWTRHTRDAVLGLLALVLVLAVVVRGLGGLLLALDPIYVLAPGEYLPLHEQFRRLLLGLGAWGGLSFLCLTLAVWRLRPAYLRQLVSADRPTTIRWLPARRPPVNEQPVRWKERQVEGLAPLQVLKGFPRWLGLVFIALATLLSSGLILWFSRAAGITALTLFTLLFHLDFVGLAGSFLLADYGFWWQGVITLFFFSLLVGVRCSGSVSGERDAGPGRRCS